jgi:hypothetical protein
MPGRALKAQNPYEKEVERLGFRLQPRRAQGKVRHLCCISDSYPASLGLALSDWGPGVPGLNRWLCIWHHVAGAHHQRGHVEVEVDKSNLMPLALWHRWRCALTTTSATA